MILINPNTLFIGRKVHYLDECDSTNNYAQQLIHKNNAIEGEIVVCAKQSGGKGQFGNKWDSEEGKNLTFSVILSPQFITPDNQFTLNMAASLAVLETLNHFLGNSADIHVKWPNDVLINGYKTCGILIENTITSSKIKHSVIGVGLNVNQEHFEMPFATSLQKNSGKSFELSMVLNVLLQRLEKFYLFIKNHRAKELKQLYLQHLFGFQTNQLYTDMDGHSFSGIITGITKEGKLILDTEGKERIFNFKEVKLNPET